MSCITEILKLKGSQQILRIPGNDKIVIEGGGIYKKFEYLITFNWTGTRCGYVAINSANPFYNVSNMDDNLDVHGGVSFHDKPNLHKDLLKNKCDDEWIGFDANHLYDKPDFETVKKYGLIDSLSIMSDYMKEYSSHRDYQYIEKQCKKLINQLKSWAHMRREVK